MKVDSRTFLTILFLCLIYPGALSHAQTQSPTAPAGAQSGPSLGSPSAWAPELQVAVFSAVVTTMTSLVAFFWGRREKKKALKAEQAMVNIPKSLEGRLEDRIGYKIGGIYLSAEINNDGSFEGLWRWEKVQRVRQDVPLTQLPGELWYSPPDCRITKLPTLKPNSYKRELEINILEHKDNRCKFQVEIAGGLGFGDELTYEYEAEVYKGFFMTREELEKNGPPAFQKEYWSFTVVTPVDKIELKIQFPNGFGVDTFVGVYPGDTPTEKSFHSAELDRLEKHQSFKRGVNWANLVVDSPIMGFTYLIYWVPPSRKDVDASAGRR